MSFVSSIRLSLCSPIQDSRLATNKDKMITVLAGRCVYSQYGSNGFPLKNFNDDGPSRISHPIVILL